MSRNLILSIFFLNYVYTAEDQVVSSLFLKFSIFGICFGWSDVARESVKKSVCHSLQKCLQRREFGMYICCICLDTHGPASDLVVFLTIDLSRLATKFHAEIREAFSYPDFVKHNLCEDTHFIYYACLKRPNSRVRHILKALFEPMVSLWWRCSLEEKNHVRVPILWKYTHVRLRKRETRDLLLMFSVVVQATTTLITTNFHRSNVAVQHKRNNGSH
jgi:hypothetical protein